MTRSHSLGTSRGTVRLTFALAIAAACAPSTFAAAQQRREITLDEALSAARVANAHLPVAALNVALIRQRLREQQAQNKPGLSWDGDLHAGAPTAYSGSDARLQLVGADTLFDGGRLRAAIASTQHLTRAATAGYRVVEKDLELAVRSRYADGLHAQQIGDIRRTSLDRLRNYLTLVQAQRAGGMGVASDVLRTQTHVASEEANIADAEGTFDDAEVDLNNLMGLPARGELTLQPMPLPVPPITPTGQPWTSVPDILNSEATAASADALVAATRADRRPQLWVSADVGRLQTIGSTPGLNVGTGNGAELTLWFNWPIWDFGGFKARLAQAQLAARQAADSATVVRRQAELEWSRAVEQIADFYHVYELRSRSVPVARDSYLQTESLYRGGIGTALDVIDAFSAWVDAQIAEADAILDYRQAEARLIRWGTP